MKSIIDAGRGIGEAILQATDRGWSVSLNIGGVDDFVVWAHRGDSNCPHQKPYSKTDGHGFESTEETDFNSLDEVVAWMLALEDYKR